MREREEKYLSIGSTLGKRKKQRKKKKNMATLQSRITKNLDLEGIHE